MPKMDSVEFSSELNKLFPQIQDSVPYNHPDRAAKMAGHYAMYIGMLEGMIKNLCPINKRAETLALLQRLVKDSFK